MSNDTDDTSPLAEQVELSDQSNPDYQDAQETIREATREAIETVGIRQTIRILTDEARHLASNYIVHTDADNYDADAQNDPPNAVRIAHMEAAKDAARHAHDRACSALNVDVDRGW